MEPVVRSVEGLRRAGLNVLAINFTGSRGAKFDRPKYYMLSYVIRSFCFRDSYASWNPFSVCHVIVWAFDHCPKGKERKAKLSDTPRATGFPVV